MLLTFHILPVVARVDVVLQHEIRHVQLKNRIGQDQDTGHEHGGLDECWRITQLLYMERAACVH